MPAARQSNLTLPVLTVVVLTIAALTIILPALVPACAQTARPDVILSAAPGETHEVLEASGASSPAADPAVATNISPARPVVLPDAPVPVKVVDKKFIAMMAALGAAETLRFTTHKLVLDNEYAAGAPWVRGVPANQELVLKYAGIYAAEVLLAYELKKPHSWLPGDRYIRKLWWVAPAALIPIHIKNGVRSIRTQDPTGACPPEFCEAQ